MAAEQAETKRDFRPGDIVKHFKRETLFLGSKLSRSSTEYLYKIIGIAEHTETKEKMVVYQALYKSEKDNVNFGLYVRPYDMFLMMFRSSNRERRKIENKLKEAEHKKCLSERQ